MNHSWVLFMTANILGAVSFASTKLPYVGPKAITCEIKRPSGEFAKRDAGYETDEACKIIYVKPPLLGHFNMNKINLLRTNDCAVRNSATEVLAKSYYEETKNKTSAQIGKITDQYNETFSKLWDYGYDKAYLQATGYATLDWQVLVQNYQDINPNMVVKALPISVGLLTMNKKNPFDLNQIAVEEDDTILSLRSLGLELPSFPDDAVNWPVPDFLRSLIKPGSDRPVLMGQTTSLELKLNLAGTCSFYDKTGLVNKDPSSYISANYTYFYPVQTDAAFSVNWDDSVLEAKLLEVAKKYGGKVTAAQLSSEIADKNIFTIQVNPGAFSEIEAGERLYKEFKDDVLEYASELVLQQISQSVVSVIEDSTYNEDVVYETRSCRKRLLRSKKCSTHRYVVTNKRIDWGQVRENLAHLIKPTEASAREYRNYYLYDSSSFKTSNSN